MTWGLFRIVSCDLPPHRLRDQLLFPHNRYAIAKGSVSLSEGDKLTYHESTLSRRVMIMSIFKVI